MRLLITENRKIQLHLCNKQWLETIWTWSESYHYSNGAILSFCETTERFGTSAGGLEDITMWEKQPDAAGCPKLELSLSLRSIRLQVCVNALPNKGLNDTICWEILKTTYSLSAIRAFVGSGAAAGTICNYRSGAIWAKDGDLIQAKTLVTTAEFVKG